MISKTGLHTDRLVQQLQQNLIGLHRDIHSNAQTHKKMAQSQSPDIATLRTFVADCQTQYLRRLGWATDFLKRSGSADSLAAWDYSHGEISQLITELERASSLLSNCSSYRDVIQACDKVLALVDAPESLWPE